MKALFAVMIAIMLALPVQAQEVAGVRLDKTVTVNNHTLKLNGYGIRKKFFVKVYIGSLYSENRLPSAAEALKDTGGKLIRMNFLHSKVEKEKIIDAFNEGFASNAPEMVTSAEVKKFLSLFSNDFSRGDVVDLVLGGDGMVSARHNGKALGSIASARLAKAVLAIYLGDKPADDALKNGMLGK